MDVVIGRADPRADDVIALVQRHLVFARACTPPESVFALEATALVDPTITLFGARRGGDLVAIGALKELDPSHGELKSMHTDASVRGQGVGTAMVEHLIEVARERGYARVSLETGSQPEFEPARALYRRAGFRVGDTFADYPDGPMSTFMTLTMLPSE